MRRPWETSRSMAAFVDKVELSLCSEDRFSRPRAPRNALGGVPDRSREHPRIPSGTPHRPHRAEVAPEPVGPRVSSPSAATLGHTPAHPPPSPYTNPSSTSSSTLPLEHRPPRLAGSANSRGLRPLPPTPGRSSSVESPRHGAQQAQRSLAMQAQASMGQWKSMSHAGTGVEWL